VIRRAFWPCWFLATVTTGLVAGFMLGHALILGRFLDWLLATDARLLASTYPVFAGSAGSAGLTVFYAVCGLQVVAGLALLALATGVRRYRAGAGVAALAAVLWPVVHYASGFGAVEAMVLRSPTPVSADVTARFLASNGPVHGIHAALLLAGLVALLWVPVAACRDWPPAR
jgi:hypothetical protein